MDYSGDLASIQQRLAASHDMDARRVAVLEALEAGPGDVVLEGTKLIDRCVMVTRPQPDGIERDLSVLTRINAERSGCLGLGTLVAAAASPAGIVTPWGAVLACKGKPKLAARYATIDLAHMVRVVASHFDGLAAEREVAFVVETPEVASPLAFGVLDKVVALPPGFMAHYDLRARDLARVRSEPAGLVAFPVAADIVPSIVTVTTLPSSWLSIVSSSAVIPLPSTVT